MKDLTKGNPTRLMLSFALPVCLGNIFQLFYSLADTRIVGSTLGNEALAAIGATTAITTLLIGFLQGLTNGFSIIVAQCFGAKQTDQLKKASAGTFLLSFITTILLTALALLFLNPLLHLLNVPQDLFDSASAYIRILLIGMLITMLYNALAGILRAVGDTVAPLLFLICASLLNIVLDLTFILVFHLGVRGAAYATILSQMVSVVLCFTYMWKRYPIFHLEKADFHLDSKMVKKLYSSGFSMALMMSLVFFGTLALQCTINTFGTDIIVAHTAARKVTEFNFLPISVMGITMSTFCSQNFGAGQFDRVKTGIRQSLLLCWLWVLVIIFLAYTCAPFFIYLVTGTKETAVTDPASLYLIELVGKILIAFLLAPVLGYMGIIIAEPIIWCFMVIPLIVKFVRTNQAYRV